MRHHHRLTGIAALLLIAAIAWGAENTAERQPPLYPQRPDNAAEPVQVVRVVDGDTIIVMVDGQQVRVRLLAVDTPETVHPQKPVEVFGREASAFTANLLTGESVWLSHDPAQPERDRYGRMLAHVWRYPDGLWVNAEIVRQGYGHADTRPGTHRELFKWYEADARESGRGLWGQEK